VAQLSAGRAPRQARVSTGDYARQPAGVLSGPHDPMALMPCAPVLGLPPGPGSLEPAEQGPVEDEAPEAAATVTATTPAEAD
jgi:hypothetical protein